MDGGSSDMDQEVMMDVPGKAQRELRLDPGSWSKPGLDSFWTFRLWKTPGGQSVDPFPA